MSPSDLLAHSQAALLVGTLLKGAVLLTLAWGLAYLLREKSAALRHGIWTAAFAGLLALPLIALTNVNWTVETPVARVPAWEQVVSGPSDSGPGSTPGVDTPEPGSADSESAAASEPAAATAPNPPTESQSESSYSAWGVLTGLLPDWSAGDWILIVWSLGALVEVGRLAYGFGMLSLARRRARALGTPRWTETLDRARRKLNIDKDVRLLTHSQVSVPMTWGIGQAALLLPEEAQDWSEEEIEVVLLHELGHIKRRDYLTHLIAEIARALHWPNPLAWLGTRRLITEREKACDDLVVRAGVRPSRYAEQLLAAVDRARELGPSSLAAPAMARPSKMAERIRAICSPDQNRSFLQTRGWLGLGGVALGLAMLAGTFGGCQESVSQDGFQAGELLPRESDIPADSEVDVLLRRRAEAYPEPIASFRSALLDPTIHLRSWQLGGSPESAPGNVWDAEITPSGRVYLIDREYQQLRVYSSEAGYGYVGQLRMSADTSLMTPGVSDVKWLEHVGGNRLLVGNQQRGLIELSVQDTTATVKSQLTSVPPQGGFCTIGEYTYVRRAFRSGSSASRGLVHKINAADEVVTSFGARFPGQERAIGEMMSRGTIGCHAPSETIFVGYGHLPILRAYDTEGHLKWSAKLKDFRPYKVQATRDEEGRLSFRYSARNNPEMDRIIGFHRLSDEHVLIQVRRVYLNADYAKTGSETYSYVVAPETGEGYYLGTDVRYLFDLDETMAAGGTRAPASQLLILEYPGLRGISR